MADNTATKRKVEDYLKRCPGRSATTSDIANGTGVPLQLLQKLLYQLKNKKVVFKHEGMTPPKWSLRDQRNQPRAQASESSPKFNDQSKNILEYLSLQSGPKTAIDIARHTGHSTKKEVNRVLYTLKRDQLVDSNTTQGKKPVWCLSGKAAAMADELFRDTSRDTSAPGAYTPEKRDDRGSGLHYERQQHRQVQREHRRPYSTGSCRSQRSRNASGSGHNVALTSILSSPPKQMKESDSGIIADSGNYNDPGSDANSSGEGMMVTLPGGAGGHHRTVTMVNSGQTIAARAGDPLSRAAQIDKSNTGDDSFDLDEDGDDFEEENEYGPHHMATRYQDMMGDLMFMDMTYFDDEEMPDDENSDITLDNIVLDRIGSAPNHTISVVKLAKEIGKAEEEIRSFLRTFGEKVKVSSDLCSLTDTGKALVKEKLDARRFLDREWSPHHLAGDGAASYTQEVLQTPPRKGPPLSPRELIATDPIFGMQSPGWSSTEASPSKVTAGGGKGRGQVILEILAKSCETAPVGKGRVVSGMHDVRDLEAQPVSLPPPSSCPSTPPYSSPSKATATSTTTTPSTPVQEGDQTGSFLNVQNFAWKPLIPTKSNPPASTTENFNFTSLPQGMTTSQTGQGVSMPVRQNMLSIRPELRRFTQEGLTVVAAPLIRTAMIPPEGAQSSSLGVGMPPLPNPATSIELIAHQMGKTGLTVTAQSMGQVQGGSFQLSGPMSIGIPQSHSQPLLSSGPASMSAGESANPTLQITSESFAALNKNPISALMEYAQSRRMQAIIEVVNQRGPSHRPVFVMAARVGDRQFPGVTCHNKKDGRKEAADVALRTLIAEGQYSAASPTPSINVAPENMTHFDKIAALTHQTFNSLIATIPENLAGRKVIAGLVMKRSDDDLGVVISIGTGNRCITGDKLSLEGNTVNDSHAEIVTRRGFMRFLYQQLLKYENGKPHDLFEPGTSGKLRVKSGITFHLYISTAPCGDGALFSPRDVESNSGVVMDVERKEHSPTFTSNVQGLLRTKMEGGEGTIPVDTKEVTMQTWDGVVRGERLRTMSCTDKICRWNVLGLQGALLSHFLEPIYLDSLTLGFLYDHGHLSRAVCCRLAREPPPLDGALPPGFHLNHPWLGRVTACQPLRETQKTKAFSINWTSGDPKAEVLDGTLGHCYTAVEKRLFSRLAKRSLYDSFKEVAQHLGRSDLVQAPSYHHSKMAAQDFQAAKAAMIRKFQQMGCGWVKKPVEEEMFS